MNLKLFTLWDRESEKTATGSCVIDGNTVEIRYGSKANYSSFQHKA